MKLNNMPILIIMSFFFQGCFFASMPSNPPKNFRIHLSRNGGMLNQFKTIHISTEKSYYKWGYNGLEGEAFFVISKKELDNLYNELRRLRFTSIRTDKIKVYDRGGESINISWKGKSHTVTNSGMFFVRKQYRDDWNNILKAIKKAKDVSLASEMYPLRMTVVIDDISISDLRIQLNDSLVAAIKNIEADNTIHSVKHKYLPAKYYLNVFYKLGKIHKSDSRKINLRPGFKSLRIRIDTEGVSYIYNPLE